MGSDVLDRVRGLSLGGSMSKLKLEPANLASEVKLRFVQAWLGNPQASLCPAFHGTRKSNILSIYEGGLLIPGVGNSLPVVHGSAHGLGIYTAALNNASLSYAFAGAAGKMLVCGVLDDSVKLKSSTAQLIGRQNVVAESGYIRRVGDAIVIFDAALVAPLFAVEPAEPTQVRNRSWQWTSRPAAKKRCSVHHPIRR